jgi:hypothetical protein
LTALDLLKLGEYLGAITAFISLGGFIWRWINGLREPVLEIKEHMATQDSATRSLLRDRIRCVYRDCAQRGSVAEIELQAALDMHEKYRDLGGNGFVDELINDLKALPRKESNDGKS